MAKPPRPTHRGTYESRNPRGANLPVLFLAHGSPMLAAEGGAWGETLKPLAAAAQAPGDPASPRPTGKPRDPFGLFFREGPGVMHDFGGFPARTCTPWIIPPVRAGAPGLAGEAARMLREAGLEAVLDPERRLDHGAWVPLPLPGSRSRHPRPAGVPPAPRETRKPLSPRGVPWRPCAARVSCWWASGGVVHNLRLLDWEDRSGPQPWARAFQDWVDRPGWRARICPACWDWRSARGRGNRYRRPSIWNPCSSPGASDGPPEARLPWLGQAGGASAWEQPYRLFLSTPKEGSLQWPYRAHR